MLKLRIERFYGFDPNEDPEKVRLKLTNQRLSEKLRSDTENRGMRRKFAKRVYSIANWWLRGVFLILLFQGFKFGCDAQNTLPFTSQPFNLSDTVLTALLAATGAIGLLAIVLRNLFPGDSKDEPGEKR